LWFCVSFLFIGGAMAATTKKPPPINIQAADSEQLQQVPCHRRQNLANAQIVRPILNSRRFARDSGHRQKAPRQNAEILGCRQSACRHAEKAGASKFRAAREVCWLYEIGSSGKIKDSKRVRDDANEKTRRQLPGNGRGRAGVPLVKTVHTDRRLSAFRRLGVCGGVPG
jgi:hypothetical protein